MGLRLVDDGKDAGDDRAALAEARQSVVGARLRLQALADRLGELRRRLAADAAGGGEPLVAPGQPSPNSGGSS